MLFWLLSIIAFFFHIFELMGVKEQIFKLILLLNPIKMARVWHSFAGKLIYDYIFSRHDFISMFTAVFICSNSRVYNLKANKFDYKNNSLYKIIIHILEYHIFENTFLLINSTLRNTTILHKIVSYNDFIHFFSFSLITIHATWIKYQYIWRFEF